MISDAYKLDHIGHATNIRFDSTPDDRPWKPQQLGALRPHDTILFTTACKMRYGDSVGAMRPVADGWLCVTDERITFTPFEEAASDEALGEADTAASGKGRDASSSMSAPPIPMAEWYGQAGWVTPADLPLELSAVEVSAGARADLHLRVALGLKWAEVGTERPAKGCELLNTPLAAALRRKTKFTWDEFGAFGAEE
eukprot:7041917-Prymnesium_polylepis.1